MLTFPLVVELVILRLSDPIVENLAMQQSARFGRSEFASSPSWC